MDKFLENKMKDIMKTELFADKWKKGARWKDYDVYIPIRKKRICLGYPFVVLVKGGEVRSSTPEESLSYRLYENKIAKKRDGSNSTKTKKKSLEQFKKEMGAKSLRGPITWNGYEVYVPEYNGSPKIGPPWVILKKGDKVRISTYDEAFDFLDWELEQDPKI